MYRPYCFIRVLYSCHSGFSAVKSRRSLAGSAELHIGEIRCIPPCCHAPFPSLDVPLCVCVQHPHEQPHYLQSLLPRVLTGSGNQTGPQPAQGQTLHQLTVVAEQFFQDGKSRLKSGKKGCCNIEVFCSCIAKPPYLPFCVPVIVHLSGFAPAADSSVTL